VRRPWIWILLLVVGILLPRIYLIVKFHSVLIESDEAIVGLMARHILQGELPVFYYGQNYMGTIEPFFTAALFLTMGPTSLALKVAPLILFCVFLVVHYHVALLVSCQRTAILATTLAGISPAFLSIWSMKSRGGYMALLLLGTLSLFSAVKILQEGYSGRCALLLGLAMGLAWWTHFLAIFYIVPILVVLLLKDENRFFSRHGCLTVAGLLLGSLPFWIYNAAHSWVSLAFAARRQTDLIADLRGFFGTAIPIFLGARRNWNRGDLFPFSGVLVLAIFLVCCAILVKRWFGGYRPQEMCGRHLLLVFVLMSPVLFSASGFAWFVNEPRYLISLYSAIYILILMACRTVKLQWGLAVFLLLINLGGTFLVKLEDYNGYTNVESNDALITFLKEHQVRAAYAPYWIAYRLTFETGETIICTPPIGDAVRYHPYLEILKSAASPAFIRLSVPRYRGLHFEIRPPEHFGAHRIGNYEVFLPPAVQ
jgi:hypothetical protein